METQLLTISHPSLLKFCQLVHEPQSEQRADIFLAQRLRHRHQQLITSPKIAELGDKKLYT